MSEERPQHTQEPAEGADEDVEARGAEKATETDGDTGGAPSTRHTEEPAEGSDESVDEPGAERSGGSG
ncbi:hypothetical protein GBA65_06510 [Rubrobacter marinus]|uniref:Uncharacterized protein n=1 Tax=Rubrobacter marinus TaxID=2653852 RepID=A0A6G8PVI5_9ACTN|nr:hypothetical protein [Rubrobacter marinus]QIN78218.1 hypothetical protein GBA65_06510 [Rubrobacter marinus]